MMSTVLKSTIRMTFIVGMTVCLAAGQEKTTATMMDKQSTDEIDCSGKAKACAKPVKFLSRTPRCVCFTCAYGTPESRPMCTKNRSEAKSMAALAQKSGNDDQEMYSAVASLGTKDLEYVGNRKNEKFDTTKDSQRKAERRHDKDPQ
jgi:hypothetical protein